MRLKFTSETIDKSTEIVCTAGEHIGTYSFPPIKLTLCLIYIDAVTGATAIGTSAGWHEIIPFISPVSRGFIANGVLRLCRAKIK